MKNVKWLFFDIGSTLVDESKAYEHRLRDVIADIGISFDEAYAAVVKIAENGNAEPIKAYAKEKQLKVTPWHSEDENVFPQAKRCLEALHERFKIGIIANQPKGTAERLEKYGLIEYIDVLVSSFEERVAKPNPKIFYSAIDKAGCKAEEAVMIGDRLDNDIVPAKKLGMKTIWIRQGFGGMVIPKDESEKADICIENLDELSEIFSL